MRILGKSAFGKPINVRIVGDADKAYAELVKIAEEETKNGIKSSENQTLFARDTKHY
jgi:hypothetical protein